MMNNIKSKSRVGAPKKMEDGRRTNIYISKKTETQASNIGNGILSEGIRIATDLTDGLPLKLRYILHSLVEGKSEENKILEETTDFILNQLNAANVVLQEKEEKNG